jgi:GH25 family lysozyme M1 (1,4-beta-N-acetylmuramidase)
MTELPVRRRRRPSCIPFRQSFSEPLESRVLMARVLGLDVSQFQGAIDWNEVAANGKQFVFMRASRTNLTKDPTFDANAAGAKAAGLLIGPYHFVLPNNVSDAGPLVDPLQDADKFFAAAGSIMTTGYLPPVIDVEAAGAALGKAGLSNWVNAFSDEIFRLSGVRPIVYANINYAVSFLDTSVSAKHKLWLARYNGGNVAASVDPQNDQPEVASFHPNPYGAWNDPLGGARSDDSWRFWQYTSTGDGLATGVSSTNLDLDVYNGDLEQLKKEFLIGYQKNFGTADNNPFTVGPGVTTTIQAEAYDIGGEGISYHDLSPAVNTGGVFRTSVREGADVAPIGSDTGTGAAKLTDTHAGEYVEYTIDVSQAGDYQFDYFLAQSQPGATLHAEIDGQALATLNVPDTESGDAFAPVSQTTTLAAGQHVLRLVFDGEASNGVVADVDKILITQAPTPPVPPQAPAGSVFPLVGGYVRGGPSADQNFSYASELLVQRGKGAANTAYAYLKFDLSSVPSITSAKLRLVGRLADSTVSCVPTDVLAIGKVKQPLQESTLTFKNKPAGKKRLGSITVSGTTSGAYELDLTSFLQSEFAAGRKMVMLQLRNITKSNAATVFASDESGNAPAMVLM